LRKDVEFDNHDMPAILTVGNTREIMYPWGRVFQGKALLNENPKEKVGVHHALEEVEGVL
jgi:hypothetical protein